MKKNNFSFKMKLLSKFCLFSGLAYSGSGLFIVNAEDLAAPMYAEFDRSTLAGGSKNIDLSLYTHGNPVLPGTYNVTVYVNGEWIGKQNLVFKNTGNDKIAEHCFDIKQLISIGVDISKITIDDKNQCLGIDSWIPNAFSRMNPSKLQYDISVPQAYMKRNARGYVPPEVWDRGINAGFISYNFNTQQYKYNEDTRQDTYLSLNTGLNLLGWQFRHNGINTWYDNQDSDYTSINTYAQKAFPSIRSILTLGESYTGGDIFDSFGYTGAQLRSDDRMLPDTQTGYAPVIRGIAQSNAIVEVRQNDQLIYQTSVTAGEFIIDDLYPTGYGGNMDVTVRESNGQIQTFVVPYSSLTQMLRPGHDRYSITAGQVRNSELIEEDTFVEATYQRGITNYLTGYTGTILSENYQAMQWGGAFGTPIGAVSVDMTHSRADHLNKDQKTREGQSYRISYNKYLIPTKTNFTLAAYRYSTSGFYGFQDANRAQDYLNRGLVIDNLDRKRSQFQLAMTQNLSDGWGNFYFNGVWSDYWNNRNQQKSFQVGYNNNYKSVGYSFSAQRTKDAYGDEDDHYYLSVTLPLEFRKRSATLTQMVSDDGNRTSISGSLNDDRSLSYGASVSNIGYSDTSASGNLQYISPYATVNAMGMKGDDVHQLGLNVKGALVGHSEGISFSPSNVDTMVLVHAENAKGATVNNTVGLKVDPWGYAVIPYARPYRINDISLDPKGVSDRVELLSSSAQLAPYAGAITKVNFKTKSGFQLLIKSKTPEGSELPFASNVYNSQNELVGVVSQGSQIFIRTDKLTDVVTVKWGDLSSQQCQVNYNLNADMLDTTGYKMIEEQCK